MENFNVTEVSLDGCKLIEASAGTGKTHSVGILVLRLLLEKNIKINQIMMVTFTQAAVEEMKSRIRNFVYQAWQYSHDSSHSIDAGVKQYLAIYQGREQELQRVLNEAVSILDEVSIFTIHGFCARTLKEFAFETNQSFDLKMTTDFSEILYEALHIVWRKNITTLPPVLLKKLFDLSFSDAKLAEMTKAYLDGCHLRDEVLPVETDIADILNSLENLNNEVMLAQNAIATHIENNEEIVMRAVHEQNKGSRLYKLFNASSQSIIDDLDSFVLEFKKSSKIDRFNTDFRELIQNYTYAKEASLTYSKLALTTIYHRNALEIVKEIQNIKNRRSIQTFDDLIHNLHRTVTTESGQNLCKSLRAKYKAVFIDEFQDTDKYQYEIFSSVFMGHPNTIFFIGDPKQSIYSFRKADLDVYKLARSKSETFTMYNNYRSNEPLLEKLNRFFGVEDPFADNEIAYTEVGCGKPDLGRLVDENGKENCFECFEYSNKGQATQHMVEKILRLLAKGYSILEKGKTRKILPSDIGILVRNHIDAKSVKQELGKKGLPAVVVDESNVFHSEVATYVSYILLAINQVNNSSIYQALGTPLFLNYFNEIARINIEKEILHFEDFKNIFESKGVYSMFQLIMKTYNVRGNLLMANEKNGQRLLTNLIHLVELLQHEQSRFKMSGEEMIDWLKRAKEEGMNGENSFEQRLESDENAVNIVTVHKAKGLAYNIVFTPFLESTHKPKFITKYKQGDKYFISLDCNNNEEAAQAFAKQYEQEERRIVYVALTRAVYYCGIYTKPNSKNTLGHFTNTWQGPKESIVNFESDSQLHCHNSVAQLLPEPNAVPALHLFDKQWAVLSYSGIVSTGQHAAVTNVENPSTDAFEQFVFDKMPKGVFFGSFVHEIFEKIDFADSANWENIIRKTGQKHLGWPHPLSESQMADMPFYMQWFQHICKTRLTTAEGEFSLSNIENKLHELEFYFPYDQIDSAGLKNVLQTVDIEIKDELYMGGMMNGFIDLVFEHGGKYYLLDWKTNFLGNNLQAYGNSNLDQAMIQHNYHLQYLIYTVALCRYLQTRIPNFEYDTHFGGVYYLFVRGIRQGQNTGIFFDRYTKQTYQSVEKCFGKDLLRVV